MSRRVIRRRATAAAALVLAAAMALPAAAQSTLERLEAVSVEMNAMMNAAMIAEVPALDGNMPDPAWDEPLRQAYTCMHDAYVAEVGDAPVAVMVSQMEAQLETLTAEDLLTGAVAVENPEGISDDQALEIVSGCGLMEVFMARLADSGAIGIMMQQQQ
jgi:hypothetical protein